MKYRYISIAALFTLPSIAFAAAAANFKELAEFFLIVIQNLISIMFAAMTVGLLYGVVLYFINSDNEKKREEIRGYLVYGVMAVIAVMGLWGFIALLNSSFFGTAVGIPYISKPSV